MKIFLIVLSCLTLAAETLPFEFRKNDKLIQKALSPIQEALQKHSAVFIDQTTRKPFIYGTVIGRNGLILTKASELEEVEDYEVRVGKRLYEEAELLGVDHVWDVALVKIAAEDLVPVNLEGKGDLPRGTWVVSNGATKRRFRRPRAGMISANAREIKGDSLTALGASLRVEEGKIITGPISETGGAAKAGLQEGDVLIGIDGKVLEDIEPLLEHLKSKLPGEEVEIEIERGDEKKILEVEMIPRYQVYPRSQSRNDQMSGNFSPRRSNFPKVIQHEIRLSQRTVGGPLFTLDSEFVGMNIAVADRVECFAIPVEELPAIIANLKEQAELE